jgi:toxin FitB
MRALLDTSVLIGAEKPGQLEGAMSAASLAELHFGVQVANVPDERARRGLRLGVIESRRRAMDLAIAATANVHRVPLLTHDVADFQIVDDLIDVRAP